MSMIRPFRALRPEKNKVMDVAAVPYDVVSREEARRLAQDNPWSFLHVSRPEIDLRDDVSPHSNEAYNQAESYFKHLLQECPLIQEEKPSLYLYRLKMGNHEQTGIVGTFSIDEYDSNQIKKHEKTRPDKEDDRTRHILKLSAQTGPVFLAFESFSEVITAIEEVKKSASIYDFVSTDSVRHTLWIIPDSQVFENYFREQVTSLYIADGHHRAAAASRVRKILAEKNPKHTGNENYNFVFAVAFPSEQLKILPYHRIVKDLNGLSENEFLEKIRESFHLVLGEGQSPRAGEIGIYLQGEWYLARPKVESKIQTKGEGLDVDLLQKKILEPVLGILDPRTDQRIEFIGGIRGINELKNKVDSGYAAVAFNMHPTQLEQVMSTSDRGEIMPPKSTWFEPKLRDGILSYRL